MPKIDLENPLEIIIKRVLEESSFSVGKFHQIERAVAKTFNISIPAKDQLIKTYRELLAKGKLQPSVRLEQLFKLKLTRSLSGIVVVSVLTKPYACPGQCLYCPSQKNTPKSYLDNEPAVMRAISHDYHPYHQVSARLRALHSTGHPLDKINIRIIGGTWSFYSKQYQTWFIKETFRACNDFESATRQEEYPSRTLVDLQGQNETAKCRVVEISIETRQDYINPKEIKRLRCLGVTKVELGVQSIYEDVLRINRRGHTSQATITATKMLRDAGFKISYQIMPNLLGSNYESDLAMFRQLFHNSSYKPDYLKIYPLALVKEAPLFRTYKKENFKPYSKEILIDLIKQIKTEIPIYCRVERIIRDIPADSIVEGGAKVSNLRQIVTDEMKKEGKTCRCIRCRELHTDYNTSQAPQLFRFDYDANEGKEIFLCFESSDRSILYSLLRLRIPSEHFEKRKHFIQALNDAALIREIHTYGAQIPVGDYNNAAVQHKGLGKKLIAEAERIAKTEFGLNKVAVISGVGVRRYFQSLGYKLVDTYMVK